MIGIGVGIMRLGFILKIGVIGIMMESILALGLGLLLGLGIILGLVLGWG